MGTLTKCTNELCPMKEVCYRFIVPPVMYQIYFEYRFKPTDIGVECSAYIYPPSMGYNTTTSSCDTGEDDSIGC